MKRRIQNPIPLTLGEFIKSKIHDYENTDDVTLGTLDNGVWQEYQTGEYWDTIRIGSVWEDCKYITIETLVREHTFYVEQFERRINSILGY
jgi:hypothetical protein